MKLKAFFRRMGRELPGLRKLTESVTRGTLGVALPCAGFMMIMYMLDAAGSRLAWPAGFMTLLSLIVSFVAAPVAAGMITYAAGASWEGRGATLVDAAHLARIRIREIVITGLVAGAGMLLINWLATTVYSIVGIVPALLGWIPLIGPVVTAVVSAVVWAISLMLEFLAHAALVMGMLPLTADGIAGRAQLDRMMNILRGGTENILCGLAAVFGLWVVVRGAVELLPRVVPLGGALICAAFTAALTVVSMVAVSVIYLKERDNQDGMRYHA